MYLMMAHPKVFVTGATGTQGGTLARLLREKGWSVRTTVRNKEAPAAKALKQIGVEVLNGSWDDEASMAEGLAGCKMLFLNLYPDLNDLSHELEQAKCILRIAWDAGVRHVVYSSIFPVQTSHPLMAAGRACKASIEGQVQNFGFDSWTILRPGFFMANFLEPRVQAFPDATVKGVLTFPFSPDTDLPLIDHHDIANFAVAAFEQPIKFHGAVIELAGDIVPANKAVRMLAEASGQPVRGRYLSTEETEAMVQTHMFVARFSTIPQIASLVNMDRVNSWGVPMTWFASFLEREKEDVVATFKLVETE
jgi:uncharacterized protein YbjT (DUF2867 family)